MAERNLNFDPTVTNVTPQQDQGLEIANAVGDVAAQAAQMSAAGKALAATAQTQGQFRDLDSQFRLQNADDPTNPVAIQKLQADRQKIIDQNSDAVPAIAMRDFTNKAVELGAQSDKLNETWSTTQQLKNANKDLVTSSYNYYNQANNAGRDFAADPNADLGSMLNYQQALKNMHQFADPILGSDKTGAYLKEFNTNYVKSFVAGVAESQPQRAAQLLNDPAISQHFSTEDIGDMAEVIQKTEKQQQLIKTLQIGKKTDDVTGLVNDETMSVFQKRFQIDQMELTGQIQPKTAAAARRVIKSADDLETQTDADAMADVVKQVYGLNENTTMKPSDYLNGVKDLHDNILAKQAAGEISGKDAVRLSRELQTLTAKRQADSTQAVGRSFGTANKLFNNLPPEYRSSATQQLFYQSQGHNLTKDQLNNKANEIIDGINKQRRTDALSIVSKTASDDVFLKSLGYSVSDLSATAKAHNTTPDNIISALRQKYAKKRTVPLAGTAPSNVPDTSEGISVTGAAPDDVGEE